MALGRTLVTALLLVFCAVPAQAALLSKTYQFKEGVILEIGADTGDGLRLDTVRLRLPAGGAEGYDRTGGLVRAEVNVSNVSGRGQKVGIAIALFDEAGQLVGVASGGTRLVPIKAARQKTYDLVFDYVNAEAHRATTFQISVETKP